MVSILQDEKAWIMRTSRIVDRSSLCNMYNILNEKHYNKNMS